MARRIRPKVIDLFAGVGGFSLGASRAGFDVAAAIDLDRHAVEAHKQNFPHTTHARRDILQVSGQQLREMGKINGQRLAGLIGGPPCQGFSTMGKMRKNDARNKLFFHFFRLVSELTPLFFICENVPGILDEKYDALRAESFKLAEKKYNILAPLTVSAADCGAATERSRVFFIGLAKDSGLNLSVDSFGCRPQKKTTVRLALEGLPEGVRRDWQSEASSWRVIDVVDSPFFRRINRIIETTGDRDALLRFNKKHEVSGFFGTKHTAEVIRRFSQVKPGKMDKISKFPRLQWDALCPTLRAGTAPDRGSYQAARPIHPDRDRVITPREGARLQGFPDWFLFHPTKWHSFRQIGNSVSPLVAESVLKFVAAHLT